jgi:hypothetical protein
MATSGIAEGDCPADANHRFRAREAWRNPLDVSLAGN